LLKIQCIDLQADTTPVDAPARINTMSIYHLMHLERQHLKHSAWKGSIFDDIHTICLASQGSCRQLFVWFAKRRNGAKINIVACSADRTLSRLH
jgi:hypothetical protein